jgi:deoxyribodipyrimidine photo-lyase
MADLVLFWHRRDLRVSDNLGLAAARDRTAKVVGIFCLDPDILRRDDIAPARVVYLLESLRELQDNYAQAGSQLLVLKGTPAERLPAIAQALEAVAVYWNQDVEPYSRERDRTTAKALRDINVEVVHVWDQLLHAPGTVMAGGGNPYTVYTPFWKNWQRQVKAQPVAQLAGAEGLSEAELAIAQTVGVIPVPTAKELGFVWENELLLAPGERAAIAQLSSFGDRTILNYDEQRNFPAVVGTSYLSAALKFGTIGIRQVWQTAATNYEQCRSDEARKNVQTWQQELAWREFYQHALYFFPELAEGAYRAAFKDFPWQNDEALFTAWCEGRTGYPIVDAAMRQLNSTGWMHNRCRMIVASFLTKDLIIDWRWGEKYFMQTLVDGDLAANNGGWQWSASSGMDPKPLRIFNPASQAQKFDPDGEYIRTWLPELRSLDTPDLLSGKVKHRDYPAPVVDHKVQQNLFKELYREQKAAVGGEGR